MTIRNTLTDIAFIDGTAILPLINQQSNELYSNTAPIKVETRFINRLGRDVTVVFRNGLRYPVTYMRDLLKDEFVVRNIYLFNSGSYFQLEKFFNDFEGTGPTEEFDKIKNTFLESISGEGISKASVYVAIDTIVQKDEFERYDGDVYLNSRDLLLSLKEPNDAPDHPFSERAVSERHLTSMNLPTAGVSLSLELIDNDFSHQTRFFPFGDRIYSLRPTRDNTRSAGLYFSIIDRNNPEEEQSSSVRMDLEVAKEKLNVYPTKEEAISAGDTKTRLRNDLIAAEAQLKEMENIYRREQLDAERELRLVKGELERRKAEDERRTHEEKFRYERDKNFFDHDRLREEDYYRRRQSERKDYSDFIKFVPTAVMGVITVWALISKHKSKES